MDTPTVRADAAASWDLLTTRAAEEPDPRRRAHLQTVLRHLVVEVAGDLDATMATLVPEPDYRVWGATDHDGPKGQEAVRTMYQASFAKGKNRLEFAIDRVMVDDEAVVTEGVFRHAYRGAALVADGVARDLEPEARYLVEYRALVVWVMTPDSLVMGEDTYKAEPTRLVRRLGPGELPHLGLPN
ncbi:nuclear transport factor 2 family protein [Pseudonocardia acidicola]|uniref:SnoaL-like domain-containing protein n=1 Tax=Pseudonocardia acidicola TaxID=2724939 RepID=A0ABX1SAT6_9PSEU|nr:nuclear transport factor 2 family protein [Pseudonocardia acidicola]NMH98220.1 SnoaL-like domain-containing protein [Pseudonocardia acidicola]